ncbi:MAG: VOC family protein [Bacteriovorax sp.]
MNVNENKETESSKVAPKGMSVKAIPDNYAGATPHLYLNMASAALDFYQKAFDAKTIFVLKNEKNRILHAEMEIGKARVMLSDEFPEMDCYSPRHLGGTTFCTSLYFEDADKVFSRALAAGAQELEKVDDQFWGDRGGKIVDPFGHQWYILTHKEDLSFEEMKNRYEKLIKGKQVH